MDLYKFLSSWHDCLLAFLKIYDIRFYLQNNPSAFLACLFPFIINPTSWHHTARLCKPKCNFTEIIAHILPLYVQYNSTYTYTLILFLCGNNST